MFIIDGLDRMLKEDEEAALQDRESRHIADGVDNPQTAL
jgi:hypothetical protein